MDAPHSNRISLTIGVGASAGGIAATKALLRTLPTNAGFSLVVIQHLDPEYDSNLAELLDRHSTLPVFVAENDQQLAPDSVYVIPPNCYLEIENGTIRLTPPPENRGQRKAIDHFFESLALACGRRSAAIIMSGTGNDGTAGLRAVKSAGGLTIVQDPTTAEHASMPGSAIDAGLPRAILPADQMASLLQHFVETDYRTQDSRVMAAEDANESLASIATILKEREDFDLEQYKPRTVLRRINRRMSLTGKKNYENYLSMLESDADERRALTLDLLINVTDFFRDPESFLVLEQQVVPDILARASESRDIRVWVPGCASGEEAYSIAIVFLEVLAETGQAAGVRIFATDMDEHAIQVARRGIYAESIREQVPDRYLGKYFARQQEGGPYRVATAVRDLVSFAVQDVINDPPFNHIDLVSCRNLLIYLRREVQEKVLRSFYFALESAGYLFLGSSEAVGGLTELFQPTSNRCRVYRKIPGQDRRAAVLGSISPGRPESPGKVARSAKRSSRANRAMSDSIERSLIKALLAPGVVVDGDGNILYNHGDWKAYMAIPAGKPRNEIGRLVLPALRSRIRTAMYKVQKSSLPTSFNCQISGENGSQVRRHVQVDLAPLTHPGGAIAICFRELGEVSTQAAGGGSDENPGQGTLALEQELHEAREELRNTIEELETSTEELKASNEEAISANEELQAANEELEASTEEQRSLNEELTNVNAQLKNKIEELRSAHNDAENFFSSTNIPTVFLDPGLRVGRYTPAAAQLLGLDADDIGQTLEDVGGSLLGAGLADGCRSVLHTLQPWRDELFANEERWFIRQVTPYRTADRRIDGVVVVFQDVTGLKQLSERTESRERQQSVVAGLGMLSLSGADAEELIDLAVRQVADVLRVDLCKVLRFRPETNDLLVISGVGLDPGVVGHATVAAGKRSQAGYTLLSQKPVIVDRLSDEKRFTGANLLVHHHAVSGISCQIKHSDPPYGVLAVHTRDYRVFTQDDANFLLSVANLLATTLRAQETTARLRDSELQFRTMANSIPQLAWITDASGYIIWYNRQWFEYTGTTFEKMKGWGWRDVHHPAHVERVVTKFRSFIESGTHWEDTFPLRGRDGQYRWFLSRAQPIRNEQGDVVRWFGTNTDITTQREQEKALRSSEEKLRLAINTNELGTFEIYLQEERTHWDPVLLDVWGVAKDEKPTQEIFWAGVHPDDVPMVRAALAEGTDPAGDGHYHVTYRVINRLTGKQSWIEASGQTLFEDGEAVRMVGLVIDITERKELEESLTRVVGELQQTDSRKNEFLAVLGHELRNPLAALNNSVDMLSLMPTAVDDVLGIMRNSVRTMSRLLDDLLDLNRISQDKIQLDLQVVDVVASLSKALDYAAGECEKRDQSLKSILDEKLLILGDGTRLEQIFVNLLTNACKYTQHGGRITVHGRRDGDDVVVEVRDTGIGIGAADLERIFDPFYQVQSVASAASGLGIGLALSKKLAELHGAEITAASDGNNRGTTFTVRFPAYAEAGDADDTENSGTWALPRPGLAIVLIDDNEDILRTLPGLLESLKCEVRTARTAEFGLELARTTSPDAVLVDIGLPDMSGHEVARHLRADGYGGLMVAISGYGHQEARERSSEVGFDYHLAKPAKLKDIASVLARVRKG